LLLKPSILQQPEINLFQPSNSALLHQYENLLDGEQKNKVLDSERSWQSCGGPGAGLCISLATKPQHQSLASKFHHLTHWTSLHVHGL